MSFPLAEKFAQFGTVCKRFSTAHVDNDLYNVDYMYRILVEQNNINSIFTFC